MSAIVGLRSADRVDIVTDAATTTLAGGVVQAICSKQVFLKSGVAIAGIGLWEPCMRFARLAHERTKNFDELTAAAPELWNEARADLPAWGKAVSYSTLVAGWSDENARLEMHVIESPDSKFTYDALCYAGGPTDGSREVVSPFLRRFADDPAGFDVGREAIAFMETLRRYHPREFEVGKRPIVGGYILRTILTADHSTTPVRANIESRVIHRWPSDRVGHPIEIDGMVDPHKGAPNRPGGLNMADILKVRDVLVAQMTDAEKSELRLATEPARN